MAALLSMLEPIFDLGQLGEFIIGLLRDCSDFHGCAPSKMSSGNLGLFNCLKRSQRATLALAPVVAICAVAGLASSGVVLGLE